MANNTQTDPRNNFVPRRLPWLLGAAMFAVFLLTLNHWVTSVNLGQVSAISGFVWQPQCYSPLMWLATYPFRWLSPGHVPLALNFFAALCGALTLAVLARSVALLPHDRTEAERQRERSGYGFLTSWVAWIPPVLAVLLGGLQLTFWQHATSFTGEMLDLLLFAIVIWQLLEYRLDEREGRLFAVAVIYGAGLAESWAFLGFFPLFLTAIIWLKKLEFFSLRFLGRMVLGGLAGLLFLLVLPLAAKCSSNFSLTLWETLWPNLRGDWLVVKTISLGGFRHDLALMALSSLLPVLVMAIRWSANFGDNSKIGVALVNNLFHLGFAVLFTVCVWVVFDPPFSPQQLTLGLPYPVNGTPFLSLYYLAALSIGYYSGYFLLVFAKKPVPSRRNVKPLPIFPQYLMWLSPVIVAGVFLATSAAVSTLIYKNLPVIRSLNDDTLLKYAQFTTQNLPRGGAILLSDSDTAVPMRTWLVQAVLAREGRAKDYPVVDTQSLNWAPYHRYLHARFPQKWPLIVGETNQAGVSPLSLLALLNQLAKTNTLYYLNPSFGYYFESFYLEPHGLAYAMNKLPEDTLPPPPLEKNLIAENEAVWSSVLPAVSPGILKSVTPPNPKAPPKNLGAWLLRKLHNSAESNPNAKLVGKSYSRSLNFWGVQLQRANELDKAAAMFTAALQLNPDNVNATINLDFNRTLRAGSTAAVDVNGVTADRFGEFRNWNQVVAANGPFDEPSFCFQDGATLVRGGLLRQAIVPFNRVRQLVATNLAARLELANTYNLLRQPDRALEALHDPLTQPSHFGLDETNFTSISIVAAAAHFQKNENATGAALLETEVQRHPEDNTLLSAVAQSFFMRGLYTNALKIIDRELARTPDDVHWLYGKGSASLQIGAYNDAVAAWNKLLAVQTNNNDVRFYRAVSYYKSDHLDAARADYRQLQSTFTNAFVLAFGLGEIAARQHDTNEAIRNFKIYLANAPTNTAEFKSVREHLTQLGGP